MTIYNHVTERGRHTGSLWLVEATWRGGHDKRPFVLTNGYASAKDAQDAFQRLLSNPHGYSDFQVFEPVEFKRV